MYNGPQEYTVDCENRTRMEICKAVPFVNLTLVLVEKKKPYISALDILQFSEWYRE